MNVTRLMILILVGAIPLVGLHGLWWSEILFADPWHEAGAEQINFGLFAPMLVQGLLPLWMVLWTLVAGLVVYVLSGVMGRFMLPSLGCFALGLASILVGFTPTLGWSALWPLFGFILLFLIWIFAILNVGRER